MHQYARYFERYRAIAASRPVAELVPDEMLTQFREAISVEGGTKQRSEKEVEQELRSKIDTYHLEIFQRTQNETTKRWTYESEVKRPYYHVTELDEPQLLNWQKYLDFEESEGDYIRIKFLYERCLVTAANYEEMWLRYARWMAAQENRQEEVRNIYSRASCIYVPITRPTVRLYYAQFEESAERSDVAIAIHEAILLNIPNYIEGIVSLVNVYRRQHGLQKAIEVVKQYIDSPESTVHARGALVSEWAHLIWRGTGDADAARQVYQTNEQLYLDSGAFWANWLDFELQQPTSETDEEARHEQIGKVFNDIRQYASLPPEMVRDLAAKYFTYLKERGGKEAMKEYMQLDQDINGPLSSFTSVPDMPVEVGPRSKKQKKLNGSMSMDIDKTGPSQGGSKGKPKRGGQPVNGG